MYWAVLVIIEAQDWTGLTGCERARVVPGDGEENYKIMWKPPVTTGRPGLSAKPNLSSDLV